MNSFMYNSFTHMFPTYYTRTHINLFPNFLHLTPLDSPHERVLLICNFEDNSLMINSLTMAHFVPASSFVLLFNLFPKLCFCCFPIIHTSRLMHRFHL